MQEKTLTDHERAKKIRETASRQQKASGYVMGLASDERIYANAYLIHILSRNAVPAPDLADLPSGNPNRAKDIQLSINEILFPNGWLAD